MVNRSPRVLNRFRRIVSVRLRQSGWIAKSEQLTFLAQIIISLSSYLILSHGEPGQRLLAPSWVAIMLVLNLIPAIMLLMLWGRRVALSRVTHTTLGGTGRLHVRLVGIFSFVAAVPMLLMVIFASLLFQYGVEFWFSDHARNILKNAGNLAQGYYQERSQEVAKETMTMAGDLRNYLSITTLHDPDFAQAYGRQVYLRNLSESAIIEIDAKGTPKTLATVDPYARVVDKRVTPNIIAALQHGAPYVSQLSLDRIETVTLLYPKSNSYLYASRIADQQMLAQTVRAKAVLGDYDLLVERSRRLQLYFNAALFFISLLIVGVAVFVALRVADRLVRPVSDMVDAARKVSAGDLSARVPGPLPRDEVGTLGQAFNTMTERLSEQTDALVGANALLERRRQLTEAVLSGVSAGVIAVDRHYNIRVINRSAVEMLRGEAENYIGESLAQLSADLVSMLQNDELEGIKNIMKGDEERTLAIKIVADEGGHVLTFDDITTQINDQRRAAWADVARRIAHEIKNPLTPIQLAAERLQRRFSKEITSDLPTYTRLTETIVRQVGDLRRMVDEFSSFARIPTPMFRRENLVDIIRQAIFLHEVAHPNIRFALTTPEPIVDLVCDRRQLSQALINIIKNAVEAINEKPKQLKIEAIAVSLAHIDGDKIEIKIEDSGVGLPQERARLAEPYVTTRDKGSGLGLAIVQKIIEDHSGSITLTDRSGGGTTVTILFDHALLETRTEDHITMRNI